MSPSQTRLPTDSNILGSVESNKLPDKLRAAKSLTLLLLLLTGLSRARMCKISCRLIILLLLEVETAMLLSWVGVGENCLMEFVGDITADDVFTL